MRDTAHVGQSRSARAVLPEGTCAGAAGGSVPRSLRRDPALWDQACSELARREPVLATLMDRWPQDRLQPADEPFSTLVQAVIGQQISTKAAARIWSRLQQQGGSRPEGLAMLDDDAILACGFSRAKLRYVRGLQQVFTSAQARSFSTDHLLELGESSLEWHLGSLRGIGPWTRQMFRIFHLGHLDLLPLGDVALLRSAARLWAWPGPDARRLEDLAEAWRPWRTVAVWFIWRDLDPEPIHY